MKAYNQRVQKIIQKIKSFTLGPFLINENDTNVMTEKNSYSDFPFKFILAHCAQPLVSPLNNNQESMILSD